MRKLVTLFAVACLALVAPVMAAELVENPAYQSWAKYKPGTSVTYAHDMAMGGMNMNMEMSQTLKEITPETATVEVAMKNSMMPQGGQTQTMKIPAKVEASEAQTSGKMPEGFKGEVKSLGKEKVTVAGKEYETEVSQIKGEHAQPGMQGMKFEGKTWTSDKVPGQMVKMEMKAVESEQGMGMTMKMALKEFVEK